MLCISDLRKLAMQAAQEEWKLGPIHWHRGSCGKDCKQSVTAGKSGTICVAFGAQYKQAAFGVTEENRIQINSPNAAYIAAASPSTILQLLDELDELKAEVEYQRFVKTQAFGTMDDAINSANYNRKVLEETTGKNSNELAVAMTIDGHNFYGSIEAHKALCELYDRLKRAERVCKSVSAGRLGGISCSNDFYDAIAAWKKEEGK